MFDLIKELENNAKINKEKGLENVVDIDYIIDRLKKIGIYEEFVKGEIDFVIENMINDEYLGEETKAKIMALNEEDINDILSEIEEDDNVWGQLNEDIEYFINKQLD